MLWRGSEVEAAFQLGCLFADDAIVVSIVHAWIGWMPPVYRRNPRRSRFGTGDSTVAIGIPLLPISAGGLWILYCLSAAAVGTMRQADSSMLTWRQLDALILT